MEQAISIGVTMPQWNKMVDLWVAYDEYRYSDISTPDKFNKVNSLGLKVYIDDESLDNVGLTTRGVYTSIEPDGRGHQ
jgi:hypothetical protein